MFQRYGRRSKSAENGCTFDRREIFEIPIGDKMHSAQPYARASISTLNGVRFYSFLGGWGLGIEGLSEYSIYEAVVG